MRTFQTNLFLLLAVTLVACGKDDSKNSQSSVSVDSQGNCTSQFVSDYNRIYFASQYGTKNTNGSRSYSKLSLEELDSRCRSFFSIHSSSVSCNALSDGKEKMIHTSELKSMCDEVSSKLNGSVQPKTQAPVQNHQNHSNSPKGSSEPSKTENKTDLKPIEKKHSYLEITESMKEKVSFLILDSKKANELLLSQGKKIVIDGEIYRLDSQETKSKLSKLVYGEEDKIICALIQSEDSSKSVNDQDRQVAELIKTTSKYSSSAQMETKSVMFVFEQAQMGISCYRYGRLPIVVKKVQEAFGSILEVEVTEE